MSVSTHAKKFKTRYIVLFLLLAPLAFWYAATPSVIVHYSKEGTEELRSIWDTQHRIYRERILPGQATVDTGHIFPNAEFFMVFFWGTEKGAQRCIDITPKWGRKIDIYLDATGRVDTSKTGPDVISRLKQCPGEPDPFRP
ncbi:MULTISPECIES: hypothetical protein [Pseudomonas]|uniref:hypothetical protein n=1 Tax=Pseudomonas TaxID=286 RepID=UPI0009C02BAF|nr:MULTISPECIES: hypothetical protein [Pseudomonas]PMY46562.1 hypothetical protein C1Y36_05310 [Pseudomonas sp. FW306-2-2C-D06C]PYC35629.1 hypothetical protein DMW99_16765 [Pseudomonas chlororaphis]